MNTFPAIPDRRDVLANLPLEQKGQLEAWLREGKSYDEISDLIGQPPPIGFSVQTSSKAVGRYYRKSRLAEELAEADSVIQSLPHPQASLKNLLYQSALTTGLQVELPPPIFQMLARYYRTLSNESFHQRV